MAAFATTTWARRRGLTTAGRAWAIEFRILANGKRPGPVSALRSTELWMRVASDHYWVDIQHAGNRSSYVLHKGHKKFHVPYRTLALPEPPLAAFGAWFASAEALIGKPFRRDRMWVQSNIKGGRDVMVAWIESAFAD